MKKKIIIAVAILLLLGGVAGGVYYFWFMSEDSVTPPIEKDPQEIPNTQTVTDSPLEAQYEIMYVLSTSANIHAKATFESPILGKLSLRDEVKVYQQSGRWMRIQEWINETTASSQWVYSEHLSKTLPSQTTQERYRAMKQLLSNSDDFEANEDRFIDHTEAVLKSGDCTMEDIAQVSGWLRSFNFRDAPIYYTYCGGLDVENKYYLNLDTGETFHLNNDK